MLKTLKKIFKRSLWTMLTVFFGIMLAVVAVGADIADGFQAAINGFLGTNPYKRVTVGETNGPDTDYFKSDYTEKDADGNTVYEKDADGIWHAVYDDQAMRKNSQEVALQAAVEGSVLLWNKNNALPLAQDSRVSMFGISSANYAFLGDGSGGMSVTPPNTLRVAFGNYGLAFNSQLFVKYAELTSKYSRAHRTNPNEAHWDDVKDVAQSSMEAGDTAVMIVSRISGEQYDIMPTNKDTFLDENNYLDLTVDEAEVLENIIALRNDGKLAKVVLLINSVNAMQFEHIKDYDIDACMWVGMGGTMSYEQIAAALSGRGDYVVSGKLPDTFVYNNYSAPANVNFGDNTWTECPLPPSNPNREPFMTNDNKYLVYQEGVYVGYRYYETRYEDSVLGTGNAIGSAGVKSSNGDWSYAQEVAYTFGYGKSYTDFAFGDYKVEQNANGVDYDVSMKITNVGAEHSGKEVLQVYLQKPYTDYDKAHGIEKPSVELVGFAKTKKLAPGESTTLTVAVKAEELKAYDADGEKSYILEEGDYYLAAGTDAHDALNNILAAKGKTTEHGMDYNGKAEFAHRIHVDANDFVKYKKSTHTGNEITNRFDDADLNRYDGTKDDQSIVYLSRNDWQGTYPTKAVSLKCTDEIMLEDMKYGHEIEVKDGDVMPTFGADNGLTIAMLMDMEFTDPLWNDVLDQMTPQEQQFMMSYGLMHIAGAESVGAPGTESQDGPAGVKAGNPTLKTTFSFPSEPTLAATFDTEIIQKVGEAFGMEILHAGYTVIYGPGGCIHRNAYGGRNWEYFSEDGVLSGKMLAAEVKGLQKYGVIVETKHFALNDTETNRYGVATFANEQTMRDIYLKAFEIGVTEGKMNGVMSSFNRIGCTWTGAHKGLLTDVLRNEWGFEGIVETDSCTGSDGKYVRHMCSIHAKAEGLLAGNDVWMCGSGSEEFLTDDEGSGISYENNATVMLALREACHRVLYAQLHSNAMNGMDASTRIIKVRVWWQSALFGGTIALSIIVGLLALMATASFIINTAWFKEKLRAARAASAERKAQAAANGVSNGNAFTRFFVNIGVKFKSLDKPKKIIVIVCSVVAVVAIILAIVLPCVLIGGKGGNGGGNGGAVTPSHVCGHVCLECGLCLDANCQDPVCESKCQGHPHECESVCSICGKCYDLDCTEEVCADKCGHGKKGYVYETENAALKNGKNALTVAWSGDVGYVGNINGNIGANITFTVVSRADTVASLVVYVNRRAIDTVFTDLLLTTVNGVEFASEAKVDATVDGTENWTAFYRVNLGCVRLDKGANTISFTVLSTDNYSGYNFDKIELLCDDELTEVHKCTQVCPTCGKCLDLDCELPECEDKCTVENSVEYKFDAENAELKDGMSAVSVKTVNDRTVVTGLNRNNGASVSFTVYAEHDITVNPVITVSKRLNKVRVSDVFAVTVGNTVFTTTATVPAAGEGVADMSEFADVNLGCMALKRGKNVVTFAVRTGDDKGFDFDRVTFRAAEEVTATPPDWYVEAAEYKFEAENAALSAGSKGMPGKNEREGIFVVHTLAGNAGAKVTFAIYAEHNAKAKLIAAFAPVKDDTKITDIFDITVNGVLITSDATVKGYGETATQLSVETILGEIDLRDGTNNNSNVIEFTVKENTDGFNIFDYITLETTDCELSVEYMAPTPDGHTHTYSTEWSYNDEYHWHAGNCDHTFKKKDRAKHEFNANNECVYCGYTRSFKFEAEWGKLGLGDNGQRPSINNNSIVGDLNNNTGATISFAIYSPEASTQRLSVNITRRKDLKIADGFDLFVNRVALDTDAFKAATFIPPTNGGSIDWAEYGEVDLGEISLNKGVNYFLLVVKNKAENQGNIDYFKFQGNVLVSIADKAVYDDGELIYEAEYADLIGGAYIGRLCTSNSGFKSPLVDGLNGSLNRSMKFTIDSARTQKVKLIAAVTIRNIDIKFDSVFGVDVNGTPLVINDTVMLPKAAENAWVTSAEVELGEIELVGGEDNTIIFKTVGTDGCNFDYIKIVPVE